MTLCGPKKKAKVSPPPPTAVGFATATRKPETKSSDGPMVILFPAVETVADADDEDAVAAAALTAEARGF